MNKEQLKYAADVMAAALHGAAIEFKTKSRDLWIDSTGYHTLGWNWEECDYRIKPTRTFRPWKPEEVPVGAMVRHIGKSAKAIITSNVEFQLLSVMGPFSFKDMLSQMEHSTDGGKTWHPCGVEESQ